MRGANVWGLPSLPITYTQLVTHMVKMHVFILALNNGSMFAALVQQADTTGWNFSRVVCLMLLFGDLAFHHYLFQGFLDLHGALYSPNSGTLLGHMPAVNFMDFVRNVTDHVVSENDTLPYCLELVEPEGKQQSSAAGRLVTSPRSSADIDVKYDASISPLHYRAA